MSEKTLEPTPHKIEEEREKGNVGRSQEVGRVLTVAAIAELVNGAHQFGADRVAGLFDQVLQRIGQPFAVAASELAEKALLTTALLSLPVVLLAALLHIAAAWLQFGVLVAPKALELKLDKLNPANNIKQIFSKQSLIELISACIKAVWLSATVVIASEALFGSIISMAYRPLSATFDGTMHAMIWLERFSLLGFITLAVIDYGVQHHLHRRKLYMSHEDMQKEFKEQEGSPEAKQTRRELGQSWLNEEGGAPAAAAPSGGPPDVVVANPTHFAVALRYAPRQRALPFIVAKGVEAAALDIIRDARDRGIPVVRDPALARMLYALCPQGAMIPRAAVLPVATIYRERIFARARPRQ